MPMGVRGLQMLHIDKGDEVCSAMLQAVHSVLLRSSPVLSFEMGSIASIYGRAARFTLDAVRLNVLIFCLTNTFLRLISVTLAELLQQ